MKKKEAEEEQKRPEQAYTYPGTGCSIRRQHADTFMQGPNPDVFIDRFQRVMLLLARAERLFEKESFFLSFSESLVAKVVESIL